MLDYIFITDTFFFPVSFQLLSKANSTISALQEQLSTRGVKETISSRLQDSTAQLQVIPLIHFYQSAAEWQKYSNIPNSLVKR